MGERRTRDDQGLKALEEAALHRDRNAGSAPAIGRMARCVSAGMHQLSNPSPKGADVKAHKRFLHAVVNNHDALWVEYLKPR